MSVGAGHTSPQFSSLKWATVASHYKKKSIGNIHNKVKYNTNNVHDTKFPSETGMCPDSYYIYI
jgi:hypothetical protein